MAREKILQGHGDRVMVAFEHNGCIISGGSANILVHSTKTGREENRVNDAHPENVRDIKQIPGSGFVSCSTGSIDNLKVWNPSLELVQTLEGHNGTIWCVTVSPSGSHIASGGDDKKVMIWSEPGEGGEWARVQVLEDHTDWIYAVCFSRDGKQLATGSWDKSINIYSFNEGNAILAHTLEGHTYFVVSLSFSPDCKLLCSGSWDESIKFWNPADGSLVKSIDQAHTSYVRSVSYSPNGRILVSAGNDKTMKIWDAETFELKHTFEQEYDTSQLTITADSNYIVSANWDKTVRITSCREFTFVPSCLTPILNLILHIVYKRDFVSFPKHSRRTPTHAHTIRLLGECVHDGGYNVTTEIISFLSPDQLPITPTRWKRDAESLILFMRSRYERLQEEKLAEKEAAIITIKTVKDRQREEIEELRQRIAELEPDEDY